MKKLKIVHENSYSDPVSPGLRDEFRFLFSYYSSDPNNRNDIKFVKQENPYFSLDPNGIKDDINIPEVQTARGKVNDVYVIPTVADETVPFLEQIYRSSIYKVKAENPDAISPPTAYIDFNTRYTDYVSFDLQVPTTYEELKLYSKEEREKAGVEMDIEYEYRAENVAYETLSTLISNPKIIPSYYELISRKDNQETGDATDFLSTNIDLAGFGANSRISETVKFLPPENINFFNEVGNLATNIKNLRIRNLDSHEPIIVNSGVNQVARETLLADLPHYVKIAIKPRNYKTFDPQENRVVNNFMFFDPNILQENAPLLDLGVQMMRLHAEPGKIQDIQTDLRFFHSGPPPIGLTTEVNQQDIYTNGLKSSSFKVYDLFDWINQKAPAFLGNFNADQSIIGSPTTSTDIAQTQILNSSLLKYGIVEILNGLSTNYVQEIYQKYVNFLNQLPTIKEIFSPLTVSNGDIKSEVLFYIVEKYEGPTTVGAPLQTFYLPNTRSENLDYYDSQIIYDQDYTYVVKEVRTLLGCEYEYKELNQPRAYRNSRKKIKDYLVEVRQYPRIKIVEIPVFQKTIGCIAQPPMVPETEIIPVRKRRNRFKIFFKTSYGSIEQVARYFDNDQVTRIARINENKSYRTDLANLIEFSDVSNVSEFLIYKSDTAPGENRDPYTIFSGQEPYLTIPTFYGSNADNNVGKSVDSAVVELKLIPDQKYYFTFLARNRLGLLSNPSEIYEIEVRSDEGYTYPIINIINEEELNRRFIKPSKKVRKIFSLMPVSQHYSPDYVASGLVKDNDSLNTGLAGEGEASGTVAQTAKGTAVVPGSGVTNPADRIFPKGFLSTGLNSNIEDGKKFKIRIVSKSTNKMFDINIQFKHERVRSTFEKNVQPSTVFLDPNKPVDGANLGDFYSIPSFESVNEYLRSVGTLTPKVIVIPDRYGSLVFYYPETDRLVGANSIGAVPQINPNLF